jgi:hypothetical protein
MRMSGPLGLLFPARRKADADMSPLSDEQMTHPIIHNLPDEDAAWDLVAPAPAPPPDATDPHDERGAKHDAAVKPVVGKPHMTVVELALLARTMKSGFTRYLEFGSGGSTLLAVRSGIDTIVSVESDRDWAETIRHHPEIEPRVRAGRAAILHADIGPTKAFGAPVDATHMDRWPSYIRLPWVEWQRRGAMPDFVFVDGRFRVAACLSVIVAWHLSLRQSPFPLIAIHDVTQERRSYQRLFNTFDSVESAESLHLLRLKEAVDPVSVFATLLGVQFDPS